MNNRLPRVVGQWGDFRLVHRGDHTGGVVTMERKTKDAMGGISWQKSDNYQFAVVSLAQRLARGTSINTDNQE